MNIPVPDGYVRTFQQGMDYLDDLGGVSWHEAPIPHRWHRCWKQTHGWFGLTEAYRCACGAIRSHRGWSERNSRRKAKR